MSTTSSRGHLAWAYQSSKVGAGTFTPASYTWKRHPLLQGTLGVAELNDALPQEVGGGLFPRVTYSNGAFVQGSALVAARLQDTIGYLLYAAAGARAVTASSGAASQITRFRTDLSDETRLPWFAFRKYTPGSTGTNGLTEYLIDCKVQGLTITIPTLGPLTTEFQIVGRRPFSADNESATGNTYETGDGLAMACNGYVQIPGLSLDSSSGAAFTGGQISLINGVSTPQQEMVIGSYHPDDFTPLARAAQIVLNYKWSDIAAYKAVFYNGSAGNWSPVIKTSSVKIGAASSANIPGFSNPYKLEFNAGEVDWEMEPPVMQPGQLLTTRLVGTVKASTTAAATWHVDLYNSADYSALPQ